MMRDRECPKCAPWVDDGDGGGPDYAQIGGGHAGLPDDDLTPAQSFMVVAGVAAVLVLVAVCAIVARAWGWV